MVAVEIQSIFIRMLSSRSCVRVQERIGEERPSVPPENCDCCEEQRCEGLSCGDGRDPHPRNYELNRLIEFSLENPRAVYVKTQSLEGSLLKKLKYSFNKIGFEPGLL